MVMNMLRMFENCHQYVKKTHELEMNLLKVSTTNGPNNTNNTKVDAPATASVNKSKDILTCPSCKVRRKDAVLTKCFHVFCMECMKTRYETRRRKCPKCNAAFGANDYRRMYFT
ncbi:E3 ubiquitin-protein ligase BRE1A [Dirofilaria immitis]